MTRPNFCVFVLLLIIFTVFIPKNAYAQTNTDVVINELGVLDSPDWVELYNIGTQSAQLSNYRLEDDTGSLPALRGSVSPGGFAVINTVNRLNNTGDTIKLIDIQSGDVVDSISYGSDGGVCLPTSSDESIGRTPDGTNYVDRLVKATKGTSNSAADPCPAPTSQPTDTPTPQPTDIPTNTPTPTAKPTLRPTEIPVPSDYESNDYGGSSESDVLGLRDQLKVTPTSTPSSATNSHVGFLPYVFIFGGAGFLGFAGFSFLKNSKMGYNFRRRRRIINHERET